MSETGELRIDYDAVLADLLARRAAIDHAIEGIRQILGIGGEIDPESLNQGKPKPPAKGGAATDIPSDAFFAMGIADAAKKYLGMMKQPCGLKEIVGALERGGLTHQSDNLYSTAFTALARREKSPGDFVRVKRKWALSEWYKSQPKATT